MKNGDEESCQVGDDLERVFYKKELESEKEQEMMLGVRDLGEVRVISRLKIMASGGGWPKTFESERGNRIHTGPQWWILNKEDT